MGWPCLKEPSMEIERLAINQVTTPKWSLLQAIDGYARSGVHGIGIWRDKLQETGVAKTRAALNAAGSWVPSLCKAGDIALLDQRGRRAALVDCRRAIDEASEIGARCVVFVAGGIGAHGNIDDARARVFEVLQEACVYAKGAGVSIGIEPFHPMHAAERGCVNTLAQAHRLRERLGQGAGVILDVFHCWWDPELYQFVAPPYVDHMPTVHLCDWRVPTRHPVTDRAMVGDGVAGVASLVSRLEGHGYRGPYEIEIFSTEWWKRNPEQVCRICIDRFTSLES